ncbi:MULTISPECIES: hypothetical protein [Leptolyngbya]|uniref:Pilus formation protein N-terminal domain-containing protein n=1 Tax=Leptolyngbya boryana CZ1 TaxID=3060204 RepID=A0AA96WQW7_LEPBY|nr:MULTISPECIES: hypothetical protein [Leptolyngbya]MBD1854759.1 hypothetical protein [Leptolyngbya sp. FACHB-1624]MBN8563809.1 hypothetical protein [Leptolyngbya sp. UWPOB_LEPTO1]MCY6494023.1 hypothetical protein [Leptolyngbya sp. GGD]WNZ44211.1 hypothetical protein Q2T42_20505 [Leptolyngbya boryana CZ1]
MKRIGLLMSITALIGTASPTIAQTSPANRSPSSQDASVQVNRSVPLVMVHGRINQVRETQFSLDSNLGLLTVNKREMIDLRPNEPVTVVVVPDAQASVFDAYSITRADGTNITFNSTGTVIQRIADQFN